MSAPSMRLGTPQCDAGQMVERSYGWLDGEYYRRTVDRSDRSESWDRAADPEDIPESYDAGGSAHAPPVSGWVPCSDPRSG